MLSDMDSEARVYLILMGILFVLFIVSNLATGWALHSRANARKRANDAEERAVEAEAALRDVRQRKHTAVDTYVHFGQTPYGPRNADTETLNGHDFRKRVRWHGGR